jgi:hypothetical protein
MDPPGHGRQDVATQPASRLGRQIQELLGAFEPAGVAAALIGGLALAPYRVVRATREVDLLVDASLGATVDGVLTSLGYRCLHRSVDAANYLRGDERVDFLYAHRPIARELLAGAQPRQTPFGSVRVISLEGLMAFKLQGFVNDPERQQDLEDIRALLHVNAGAADLVRVRGYFRLLTVRRCSIKSSMKGTDASREGPVLVGGGGLPRQEPAASDPFADLDDLMVVVEALCPVWPERPPTGPMRDVRL